MGLVHLRMSDNLEKKYRNLVSSGEFRSKSEAMRTALIEWMRDKERGFVESSGSIGEFDRANIVRLLHQEGPLTPRKILSGLDKKGIVIDKRHLDTYLFMLERSGEIEKKGRTYTLK